MTDFTVVIPARYGSSRLPGKPLLMLAGRTMIEHVIARALESGAARVLVATDDERIEAACARTSAEVTRTAPDHPTGTDRLAEVARAEGFDDETLVVNLQGDEPLMPGELLRQVAAELSARPDAAIATLATPMDDQTAASPDTVKVVTDRAGYALYFSRARIPFRRDKRGSDDGMGGAIHQRHLGVYAYRAGFLRCYPTLARCALEDWEKLEQLRALWHGYRIHVSTTPLLPGRGVDIPADIPVVVNALKRLERTASNAH